MSEREHRVLLDLVGVALGSSTTDLSPDSVKEADWDLISLTARRHRLSSLLFAGLQQSELEQCLPTKIRQTLAAAYHTHLARNTVLLHHAERFAAIAGERHYRLVLLKGAAYADHLYPDSALRPMTDVDLLLSERDLEGAVELAAKLGYEWVESSDHAVCLRHHRTRVPLELHTSLTSCPRYIGIDTESLIRGSMPASLGEVPVRTLFPEDHLVHLCLHASFQHGLRQAAINACDAFLLSRLPDFDWTRFIATASRSRLAPLVLAGAAMSHAVFPNAKLLSAIEVLRPLVPRRLRGWTERLSLDRLLSPSVDAVFGSPWSRFRWTPGLRELPALVAETLKPRGNGKGGFGWGLARCVGLLWRHGARAWTHGLPATGSSRLGSETRFHWRET